MKYCEKTNLSVLLSDDEVRYKLKDRVALPAELTNEVLEPHGFVCIPAVPLPEGITADAYHRWHAYAVYDEEADTYRREMTLVNVSEEEAQSRIRITSHGVREKRDNLLDETDWVVIRGLETGEELTEWKAYRQALRDIPDQEGFPFNVTFPVKPTA